MNDMVDTRTAGTGLAKRVRDGFRQDRRELGPEKAADKWFAPLMDRWNGLLSRDGGGFSHEERVTLAVLACAYLMWMADRSTVAAVRALKALALDEDCSLATLVLAAGEHGIRPAWTGRRR